MIDAPGLYDPDRAAIWIAEQRRKGLPLADMPAALKPTTEEAAYAVQSRVAALLAPTHGLSFGWKIGATTAAMRGLLNVPAPCAGEMLRAGRHENRASLRSDAFTRLGIECEIAVELASPLGDRGPVDAAAAAASVSRVFPAAEIVDDRYGDFRRFGVAGLIADFFFHAGIVLGDPVANWRDLDLAAVVGLTRANGAVMAEGRGADVLGHPMQSLAWLANRLRLLGRRLEAGQIVMTGSLPLPYWARTGDKVEIQLSGLGAVRIDID
jgi:2-keto-4-pentenoate hydratase